MEELSREVERLRNVASAVDQRSARPQVGEIVSVATPTNIAKDGYLGSDERIETNLDTGINELPPKVTDTIQHDNQQNERLMVSQRKRYILFFDQIAYFLIGFIFL